MGCIEDGSLGIASLRSLTCDKLAGMHRYLALGYALTIATIAAVVAIAHGVIRSFSGIETLLACEIVSLILIPAAVLIFKGTRRSSGLIRKLFGYFTFALDLLLGLVACVVIAGLLLGNVRILH